MVHDGVLCSPFGDFRRQLSLFGIARTKVVAASWFVSQGQDARQQSRELSRQCHSVTALFAAIPVILIVVAYNFVGDALRDAADPYGS